MKIHTWLTVAATLVTISTSALAEPTSYMFESITAVKMDRRLPTLTGVLRNAPGPISLQFLDDTNVSYRYIVNRCVPIFLTMMEKPGKYFLDVVIDPEAPNIHLVSCSLQIRE